MQLVQLFAGPDERVACLRSVAAHLRGGGLAAFAIVESMPAPVDAAPPLPDTREVDGWVYSSLPIEAAVDDGVIRVRRLRQTVSPDGDLSEELDEVVLQSLDAAKLEGEAREAGLLPAGRRPIPPTDAHVGSTVVLLRKAGLMELRLLALYPEQMNIYADRGNLLFLQRRCEWRGIGFSQSAAGPGEGFDPGAHDLLYLGGGQDRDQQAVAADMVATKREALAAAIDDGAVDARGLRRLPAARPQLPARRGRAPARAGPGRPRDGARAGAAADRQRRDRGRSRRRPANRRRLREPRRPDLPRAPAPGRSAG